jgi:hypothetical protein
MSPTLDQFRLPTRYLKLLNDLWQEYLVKNIIVLLILINVVVLRIAQQRML